MNSDGDTNDNAMAEGFFSSPEREVLTCRRFGSWTGTRISRRHVNPTPELKRVQRFLLAEVAALGDGAMTGVSARRSAILQAIWRTSRRCSADAPDHQCALELVNGGQPNLPADIRNNRCALLAEIKAVCIGRLPRAPSVEVTIEQILRPNFHSKCVSLSTQP